MQLNIALFNILTFSLAHSAKLSSSLNPLCAPIIFREELTINLLLPFRRGAISFASPPWTPYPGIKKKLFGHVFHILVISFGKVRPVTPPTKLNPLDPVNDLPHSLTFCATFIYIGCPFIAHCLRYSSFRILSSARTCT